MASPNAFYSIQPAFTGGEISVDVASRIDLDKYQVALLQAENAIVRPYGAVRKRPGMIYCGQTKYQDKKSMLVKFNFTVTISYMLEIGHKYIRVWRNGHYLGIELDTPYEAGELAGLRFVQSVDVLYIASGKHPVKKLMRYSEREWKLADVDWQQVPYGDLNVDEENFITPSGTTGNVTLTAVKDTWTEESVGDWIKLEQSMSGQTVSCTGGTSKSILAGDTWKITCHGTWSGTVTVEISYDDGATWLQLRQYTSSDDYNPTESGTVEEYALVRVTVAKSSGSCTADLTVYPYTHVGYAKITGFVSTREVTADVEKALGGTNKTNNWYLSAWGKKQGYPSCATFFQDRLCFAANVKYPQRIWMSMTGDYENFSVDKESGTVTDDSAISADLLSLRPYQITHMDAGNDLIVLTEGNEWTISGSETVTPTNITPRLQQNYGCNDVEPVRVGNRLVYVQRRGSIIRDMAYSYDTDSYGGYDLTLLAKHLVHGKEIVDSSFAQEPDSVIYFVRSDGTLLCLTYIMEQKVYGWSHIVTDGVVEAVLAAQQGNNDVVYCQVAREINGKTARYIEKLDLDSDSENQQDYIMLDCAVRKTYEKAECVINGLEHLEGRTVLAMGDGYLFNPKTVQNGAIELEQAASNVVIGIPYTMVLEQPNFNTSVSGMGNIQGMQQTVNTVVLRLSKSFGGEIGPDKDTLHDIVYDIGEMDLGQPCLFSGDKNVTMGSGGFNKNGRVYIRHDKPYPFTLLSVVRGVTLGGAGL